MADAENQPRTRSRLKAEMKLLKLELSPSKPHNERIRAYDALRGLLEQVVSIPKILKDGIRELWTIFQQDIVSSNEEIAAHSLTVLGIILRRAKLKVTVERNLLNTLLALITTTSRKRICTLGLWCISTQELSRPLLVLHLKMTIGAVVHGIDNPRGSMCITYHAFQALTRLTKQLPSNMREHSVSWVPPLYHKLLNWKTSELADRCLSDVQGVILPPTPELMQAVMTDVQLKLLTKMKSMVKGDEREAVSAVRAWSWLVKLLGEKFLLEKTLINEMLQVLEESFTSPSAQVRNASQVAWVSIIDAFLPSQEAALQTDMLDASHIPSRRDHPSRKRLKLLMTPLVTTISWEKVSSNQRTCCGTWMYLLCRLGLRVNEKSEFDTAVLPMLEAVFKLGPKRTDAFLWETCVDVYKSISAGNTSGDSCHQKAVQTPNVVRNHSPRTPDGQAYEGVLVGAHYEKIQWNLWGSDRLSSLLTLVKLLWSHSLAHPDKTHEDPVLKPEMSIFDTALWCWRLLVQGVKTEERSSVRPSGAHVTAVHLLLDFFSWACKSCLSQGIPSAAWQLSEILIEVLQPVILTSSFYKFQLPLEKLARYVPERPTDAVLFEGSMLTPIVFISAVWFDLILQSERRTEPETFLLRRVASIITTARSGFDVMGTFDGFAWILECLGIESTSIEVNSPGTNIDSMKGDLRNQNWEFLLDIWRTVADQLREHVDRVGDFPCVEPGGVDSNYKVTWALLLFPLKYLLCRSLREYPESGAERTEEVPPRSFKCAVSEAQLQNVESIWFKLYDSVCRNSSCKLSSSNAFIGGFFNKVLKVLKHVLQEDTEVHSRTKGCSQGLRVLGDVLVHAMKHAEVPNFALLAISRKRRKTGFGASSVRVQYLAGVQSQSTTQLRDLFIVASKLLTLSYEEYKLGERHSYDLDFVIRVFRALAGIAQQTSSQNDALCLLKVFSYPFTLWLDIGGEDGVSGLTLEPLQDALSQAWDGLLSCLQTCHPGLTFDSDLLDVQAPTLSLALLHSHDPIADRAVSFWEATYGSRVYPLKYPPALVEVFSKLRHKVEIPLPGWSKGKGNFKQKLVGSVYSRHPLAKFMAQTAGQDEQLYLSDNPCKDLVGTNSVSSQPCSDAAGGLTTGITRNPYHVESTREKEVTCGVANTYENSNVVKDQEHLVNGADEVSPPSMAKGGSLPEGDGLRTPHHVEDEVSPPSMSEGGSRIEEDGSRTRHPVESTLEKEVTYDIAITYGNSNVVKDHLVNGADEVSPPSMAKGGSLPEGDGLRTPHHVEDEVSPPSVSEGGSLIEEDGLRTRHEVESTLENEVTCDDAITYGNSNVVKDREYLGNGSDEMCSPSMSKTGSLLEGNGLRNTHHVESTLEKEVTYDIAITYGNSNVVKDREHLVNGLDEMCSPSMSKTGSLLEGHGLRNTHHVESTLEKEVTYDIANTYENSNVVKDREHLVNGAEKEITCDDANTYDNSNVGKDREHLVNGEEEASPPSMFKGGSFLEGGGSFEGFMSIVNSALKQIPDEVTSNSSPSNSPVGAELPRTSGAGTMDNWPSLVQNVLSEQGESSADQWSTQSVDKRPESQPLVIAVTEKSAASLSCTSALITPPVTSIDAPLFAPKVPAGGARDSHSTAATGDPTALMSTMNSQVSKLPCRRKKLKFQDDAQDVELGGSYLFQEGTSAPPVVNTNMKVQNLQRTGGMEETSVHVRGSLSRDVALILPATQVEDSAVTCKGNVPPSVPRCLDSVNTSIASNPSEVNEPPNRCPQDDDSSAELRSNVRNDLDLVQMKEKLALLFMQSPTLTFREIVRAEQYDGLPRLVLIELKKHLDKLKTRARVDDINITASGEEVRAGHREESQYCEEEKIRVTVDAANHAVAEADDRHQSKREDASAAFLLEEDADGEQFSGEEAAEHTMSYAHYPSRRRLRGISDTRLPYSKPVNGRSSRKLPGGRQLRTDVEVEIACSSQSRSKTETPRRRRSLNSVPLNEERKGSARSSRKVARGKSSACRRKPGKAHISQDPKRKQHLSYEVVVSKDNLHFDDSGFRIRELHRGMFEVNRATGTVEHPTAQVKAEQTREQTVRPNHSRKCRFPKRVPRTPCDDSHHETTPTVTEAADAMKVDDKLPLVSVEAAVTGICKSPVTAASTERGEFVHTLDNLENQPAERSSLPQLTSPTDRKIQGESSCKDSLKPDVPQCQAAEHAQRAGCIHEACVIAATQEAGDCNHQESIRVLRKNTDLRQEIERLLRFEDVRVYHVLAALAASPEWTTLKEVEVVDAEKTISSISRKLSQRKERSESAMFTSVPTHCTYA